MKKAHKEKCLCVECRARRYVEKVKAGEIQPKELVECPPEDGDITPIQIRYRAYRERTSRETHKLGRDVYPWERKVRMPREFSLSTIRRMGL